MSYCLRYDVIVNRLQPGRERKRRWKDVRRREEGEGGCGSIRALSQLQTGGAQRGLSVGKSNGGGGSVTDEVNREAVLGEGGHTGASPPAPPLKQVC